MGKNTAIEWADHTFNPWIGCAKVSDGCKNCYAEDLMDNRYKRVKWGIHGTRVRTSDANWKKPLQWNAEAAKLGIRYRVFCASLADVFEDRTELVEWREQLWKLIEITPNLDWLLLSKRPENMWQMLPERWSHAAFPPNVWLGTSIEDGTTAVSRLSNLTFIRKVASVPVMFLSMEPLLDHVDFSIYIDEKGDSIFPQIQWVIVGGESGPNARPMNPAWARSIRDQCQVAGIPFFFKQWGEWRCYGENGKVEFTMPNEFLFKETGTLMEKVGKHRAGSLLDGLEHKAFPQPQIVIT